MAGERKEASVVVAVTLVVVVAVAVAATSSMPVPVVRAEEKDDLITCPGEYSKLCGKDPACTTMVETTCHDDSSDAKFIKSLFHLLATVGGYNKDFAPTAWPWGMPWGHEALRAAVDQHGACPGNKTVAQFAGEHCIKDLDAACKDPSCTDGAHIECYGMASRFCYIKATPADKKAIEQNVICFRDCCDQKKECEECRKDCILNKTSPAA